MTTGPILLLAAILLACGCGGLLVVRHHNPRLLGLGWLGASFAAGGLGATLLLLYPSIPPLFSVLCADVLILLSFVLLHAAVLELVEVASRPSFGLVLLALQAAVDFARIYAHVPGRFRIVAVGVLIAAQASATARVLLRTVKGPLRAPGWFCACILTAFAAANVLRSLADALGLLNNPAIFAAVETATFVLFLAVALGIAFGFFWMTTTTLTASLERMASTDSLTRIYNRGMFLRWCEKEWTRTEAINGSFSLLMLDLDHFKQINDRHGHHTGDEVLCAVVEKMQDAVRGIDVLGRWGGEEFVVLLPGATREAAFLVAQRVRGNIEKISLPVPAHHAGEAAHRVRVTASVGVATYQGPRDDVDAMLRRADAALYEAKAEGRNQVSLDTPLRNQVRMGCQGSTVTAGT